MSAGFPLGPLCRDSGTRIKTTAGSPTAKTCRAIISGAMKLAVRYGAALSARTAGSLFSEVITSSR